MLNPDSWTKISSPNTPPWSSRSDTSLLPKLFLWLMSSSLANGKGSSWRLSRGVVPGGNTLARRVLKVGNGSPSSPVRLLQTPTRFGAPWKRSEELRNGAGYGDSVERGLHSLFAYWGKCRNQCREENSCVKSWIAIGYLHLGN